MGLLFIFSGAAKSINPFGLSIQLGDYLSAMGLTFLKPLTPLGGVLMPSLELLLGVMLLMGLSRKIAAWGVMLSMGFFTLLTLWIAIWNPVSDCGCFGDLIKLSNWETFIKNIVLLPFAVLLFIGRNRGGSLGGRWYTVAVPVSFALAFYSYFNIPLIDATPYKIGVNIREAISIPEDAPKPEIETILIYKNRVDGELHRFEIDDTEWQDESKWEYVDTETVVISEGYVPPIKSLPILNSSGEDLLSDVLASSGMTLLAVTNDLESVRIQSVIDYANVKGARCVVLTSTKIPSSAIVGVEIYNSDYSVINTIIQNHSGGALLLVDGVIKEKMTMRELMKK